MEQRRTKGIVITGPTGAIGRALVSLAVNEGYEVLAVVHRNSRRASELEQLPHCRVLKLDLSEYSKALEEMKLQGLPEETYDIFYHLAWEASFGKGRDDLYLQMKNVRWTLDAVRMAKKLGCKTFVGVGSQAEYGRVEKTLRPDTPTEPETGYGCAKLCAGIDSRIVADYIGLRHIWARVLSVYGPYDRPETLIASAVSKMLKNEETEFSPCGQLWDYLYSEDAARALLLAGEKGKNKSTYVLGSGEGKPLHSYIEKIGELTGYKGELGFGRRAYNDKQVMHLVADISALSRDTGFRPGVSFEEGIRRTIQWMKGHSEA